MIAKKYDQQQKIEDEMRTVATEARNIPERTNNNEGRAAYLQITERRPSIAESGSPSANPGAGIRVDLHDNPSAFADSPGEGLR
jgi:hypothetical protein